MMNRYIRGQISCVVAAALAALAGPACRDGGRVKTLKLGHGLDRGHSVHQAMEFMASELRARSGGRLELRIYPSEQLGNERESLELLQLGGLAMTKVSAAVLEGFAPEFKLFAIPYLFEDRAHQFTVLDGPIGQQLLRAGERARLLGLAYYDSGSRSFYTKDRPALRPEDLAGLKIRVMASATAVKMVRALGAAATPVAFGELYTALQQGVVDGAENNPPSFVLTRHHEICKHYVLDEHSAIPDVLLIGADAWADLDDDERRWLREAAAASVVRQRALWRQAERDALALAEQAGVRVHRPDKAPFRARLAELRATLASDPAIATLVEAVEAARPTGPAPGLGPAAEDGP